MSSAGSVLCMEKRREGKKGRGERERERERREVKDGGETGSGERLSVPPLLLHPRITQSRTVYPGISNSSVAMSSLCG